MNFLRLSDHLLKILFENEEIIAIDKPYGINSHTNDAKAGQADFIDDGLIEIYEKQLNKKLHIVHRLDQTTTGVIIFAKTLEYAQKYSEFFRHRQVKKTYLFVTSKKSVKDHFEIDQTILYKAKDLDAKTIFNKLKSHKNFELWQANPLTGRNHQIRIHAKAAGISLLGDEKYDGDGFPFLCLHNHKIEFPNKVEIQSEAPPYFNDLKILENLMLAKALFEIGRRQRLFNMSDTDQCFRLIHNKNDEKELGYTLDQFGSHLNLSFYKENWRDQDQQVFSKLAQFLKKSIQVRLMHNRGKDALSKSQFTIHPDVKTQDLPLRWMAKENRINYEMRIDSGQSLGLFLDQRNQRTWVEKNSKDKTVLNLFSYTCGFSVAAALGGAVQVTSVDTSKTVLSWGKRNFELNSIDIEKHKFLLRDSIDFLKKSAAKKNQYDLIICDPPSFSRGENGVFKIDENLERLLMNCLECLSENGKLLFSTNYENFFIDDIRKSILKVKDILKIKNLEISLIHSGLDFELPGQKTILKSFLISKPE